MTITDADRHRLYDALVATLGEQEATILMEHLPPVGWADVATKTDLEHLRAATKADIDGHRAETRAEFEQLRLTTKADIEHLRIATKADIDGLRAATKADIDGHRAETRADFEQLRLTTKADTDRLSENLEHLRAAMNSGFRAAQATMDTRTETLRAEMAVGFARSDTQIATLQASMEAKFNGQLRWIIGTIIASYAVMVAIAGLGR